MRTPVFPEGRTRISDDVLSAIAMSAARETPGVLDIAPPSQASLAGMDSRRPLIEMGGSLPVVQLRISARYGSDLRAVADDVRTRVREAFASTLGQSVDRVDVVVSEVVGARCTLRDATRERFAVGRSPGSL